MDSVIALTGHRKAGTSLFHRLFDGHEQLCVYPVDLALLYAYFPCFTREGQSDEQLRGRLLTVLTKSLDPAIRRMSKDPSSDLDAISSRLLAELKGKDLRRKAEVVAAAAHTWAWYSKADARRFLFKETSQGVFHEELVQTLPQFRMVSIIRDPRDNFAALNAGVSQYYERLGQGRWETLSSLLNRCRLDMQSALLNRRMSPDSFLAIRFEDLVDSPETVMKDVAQFVGIQFSPALVTPTVDGEPYEGNSFDGRSFAGVSDENVGRWYERITREDAMIIEYWLGDLMDVWRYPRRFAEAEAQAEFARFYEWYNCKYFYADSFAIDQS